MNQAVKSTLIAVLALVVIGLTGAFFSFVNGRSISFVDVASDRTRLIDDIESYWSIQELENHLRKKSLVWERAQGQRPGPDDMRPPFIVDTVKINNYTHLGLTGEMHVVLFNNRVASTMFFAREMDKYIAQLAKTEGVDLVQNKEIKLPRHTRIWRGEAERDRKYYVGWEDMRLADEMDIWIKRYS